MAIGQYQGVDIQAGDQASITKQIQAIDAAKKVPANQIGTSPKIPPVTPPRPMGGNNSLTTPPTTYSTPEVATEAPSLRSQMESKLSGMLSTPQSSREQIKTEVGFDAKQKRAQGLQNDILRLQDIRSKQIEQLEKNPEGAFGGVLGSQINQQLDKNSKELAKMNVEYRLANDDYAGAQQAVSDRLADIKDQQAYELNVFNTMSDFLQNDLTESEKLQMQGNNELNQLAYQAKLKQEEDLYNYQLETGDFSGDYPSAGQVSTSTGNYDLSTYATDPTYANKIQAMYDQYSYVKTPAQADEVIKASAPTSKLTGKDFFDVAQATGLDPAFLLAQTRWESTFGTKGAATKNTNYGGVKYVGQSNAIRGTLSPEGDYYANFNTPKDALMTQAQEVARRKTDGVTLPGGGESSLYKTALSNATMGLPENQRKENLKRLNGYLKSGDQKSARELIIRSAFAGQTGTQKEDTIKRQNAIDSLTTVQNALNEYVAKTGDTNILKGTLQDFAQKLGTAGNPELAAIGNKVTTALQVYRNSVTGAAWGEQETAEYKKIFPDYKNTSKLNNAIIDSMKSSLNSFQEGTLSAYIGSDSYQQLFKDNIEGSTKTPQVQLSPEDEAAWNNIIGGSTTGRVAHNNPAPLYDTIKQAGVNFMKLFK